MKKMIDRWVRPVETQPMRPKFSRVHLTRTFVETGDERCPIAGIWSRLECDATDDDSELSQLVTRRLLAWRALLFGAGIFIPA